MINFFNIDHVVIESENPSTKKSENLSIEKTGDETAMKQTPPTIDIVQPTLGNHKKSV